jgi:hypothetical protein
MPLLCKKTTIIRRQKNLPRDKEIKKERKHVSLMVQRFRFHFFLVLHASKQKTDFGTLL